MAGDVDFLIGAAWFALLGFRLLPQEIGSKTKVIAQRGTACPWLRLRGKRCRHQSSPHR